MHNLSGSATPALITARLTSTLLLGTTIGIWDGQVGKRCECLCRALRLRPRGLCCEEGEDVLAKRSVAGSVIGKIGFSTRTHI